MEGMFRWNSFPWPHYISRSKEVHACQEVVAYCTDLRKLNDHVCECMCVCACVFVYMLIVNLFDALRHSCLVTRTTTCRCQCKQDGGPYCPVWSGTISCPSLTLKSPN